MGNLRACSAIALLALAACGSDHAKDIDASIKIADAPPDMKVFEDAPPPMFDFSCMGNAAPTTATATVTLSGTVRQVSINGTTPSIDPLANATVDACDAATATCTGQSKLGTATSDAMGDFSIAPISTNMMPLDAYLQMTAQGSRTVLTYPASPFVADQGNIPMLTFTPEAIAALQFLGCTQNDALNGMVGVAVTDCANMPITDAANLTITIKQGGSPVTGTTVINLGMLQQQAAGVYIVCNVPEDASTEVGATYKTMALRAHNVKVVKATTTATILRPGY